MYPYYYFNDPTFIFIIIGAVISLLASARVRSTFNKYSRVSSYSGLTGASAAEMILRNAGIRDVRVTHIHGNLNDHYDPRNKTLALSDSVYQSNSIAAIGVAAHECGHAIQHAHGYAPLAIRNVIVPVANFGTRISWLLIIAGLFFNSSASNTLILAGIIAFSTGVAFQLLTLPVEFNASSRAIQILRDSNMLRGDEVGQARKVLSAAALTYVAGAIASMLQLLRLLIIFGGRRRDN